MPKPKMVTLDAERLNEALREAWRLGQLFQQEGGVLSSSQEADLVQGQFHALALKVTGALDEGGEGPSAVSFDGHKAVFTLPEGTEVQVGFGEDRMGQVPSAIRVMVVGKAALVLPSSSNAVEITTLDEQIAHRARVNVAVEERERAKAEKAAAKGISASLVSQFVLPKDPA